MLDYNIYQTASAIPEASSMIETFWAIGYNIESAVADIIDNSFSANAKNIWISFDWKGAVTWLSIKDDGIGMNNDELIQAKRPRSKNPLADKNSKDLGRFVLGLKTASFSQARQLTVLSKKHDYSSFYRTWDLGYIKQAGNAGKKVFICKRIPVPAAQKGFAWQAGYCTSKVQNRYLCTWLFLAWA